MSFKNVARKLGISWIILVSFVGLAGAIVCVATTLHDSAKLANIKEALLAGPMKEHRCISDLHMARISAGASFLDDSFNRFDTTVAVEFQLSCACRPPRWEDTKPVPATETTKPKFDPKKPFTVADPCGDEVKKLSVIPGLAITSLTDGRRDVELSGPWWGDSDFSSRSSLSWALVWLLSGGGLAGLSWGFMCWVSWLAK